MPSSSAPGAVQQQLHASSKDIEQYKKLLERHRDINLSNIAAYSEIADGLNGLHESLGPALKGALGDNLAIIAEALSKILQGLTDRQQMDLDGIEEHIAQADQALADAKLRESGITTVPPGTKVTRSN